MSWLNSHIAVTTKPLNQLRWNFLWYILTQWPSLYGCHESEPTLFPLVWTYLALQKIFSVICLCRMQFFLAKWLILLLIFMWGKKLWGPKYFWSKKINFQKCIFSNFWPFFRLTSNGYCSVICLFRMLSFFCLKCLFCSQYLRGVKNVGV